MIIIFKGYWETAVFNFIIKYLKYGGLDVQMDLLQTVINGKNIQFVDQVC